MPQIPPIDPATATGPTKDAFDEAKTQFGAVINLFKVAGTAPAVLSGLLALNKALHTGGELGGRRTELVAMLVSALNRCDYCVNVHMQVGKGTGLSEAALLSAMAGKSDLPEEQALLDFTNEVVRNRGQVSDATFERAKAAGYSDKALLETVGVIGLYTTLQYIRHVGDPAQDFPIVGAFDADLHGATDGPLYRAA